MKTFEPNEGYQELPNHPGFYISKKYPKYAANSEGVIRNSLTGELTTLRKDGHALLCKNINTGEIVEYPSMGSCALKLMAPKGLLDYYLDKLDRSKFVLNGKYVIIKKGEEWPVLVSNTKPYYAITNDWVIIDKNNNSATIYKYLDNVSKILNMDQRLIKTLVCEELISKEKTSLKFGDKSLMTYDSWLSMLRKPAKICDLRDELKRTKQGGSNPRKIKVENLITGETKIWESSEIFAKEVLHMEKKSFQRNVHRNGGYFCNFIPGSNKSEKIYKVTYLSPTEQ